jgi:hypothetical protein
MGKTAPRLWILLLLVPLLYLAPILANPTWVHPIPGSEYSDLIIAHWPSAEFLRRSLLEYGQIPFWNPHTLGGTPFAADPLSGLYYPPLWLALILPAPLAFNILFFLHLAFAGVGAFLLAAGEGAGRVGGWSGQAAPLLAGIAFGGLPKLIAHTGAGHLTLVLAVSWTPWLLMTAREAALRGSLRRWSLAGVIAGIVFLIDPRWLIPSALAAVGYALASGLPFSSRPLRKGIPAWIISLAVFAAFAAATAMVLALPMAQFVSLSTRASLSGAERAALSLPFSALPGLLLGGMGNSIEWVIYPGAVVVVLALASLLRSPSPGADRERGAGGEVVFWWILFLLSVFLSLGSNIPGLAQVLNAVPGLDLLRIPPRWMFLAGLALAMLAARGLRFLETVEDRRGIFTKLGFALAAGGFLFAAAAGVLGWPAVLWQDGLVWGALGVILFAGFFSGRWNMPATSALLCLAVIDLAVADGRMIDPRSADPITGGMTEAAALLKEDAPAYRVYSPSASLPQLAAVRYDLRTLDGIDPLMLSSTADTVSRAVGVPRTGYSVTLPAFASGSPAKDNLDAKMDLRLMGLLGVRDVASAFEPSGAGFESCRERGGIHLCQNPLALPRAWVAAGLDSWDAPLAGREVAFAYDSPNRIRLAASGPGVLILSEASYPAWRAAVDGKAAELQVAGGWWRAIEIGPGEHIVEIAYDPILSYVGLAVTVFALLAYGGVRRWAA